MPTHMLKLQKQVLEFMTYFGQDFSLTPRVPSKATFDLSVKLIQEELIEFMEAKTRIDTADALGDLAYVTCWGANAFGVELEDVYEPWPFRNLKIASVYRLCGDLAAYMGEGGSIGCARINLEVMLGTLNVVANMHSFDLGRITDEVHRSNLSKAWQSPPDAIDVLNNEWVVTLIPGPERLFRVNNKHGKIIKSPTYSPVDLSFVEVAA